jgi:uncharacterized glyoxalase superfamily protein PhnB
MTIVTKGAEMDQQRIVPMLSYEDPLGTADWLMRAFGFTDRGRMGSNVNLKFGGGLVMLGRPGPDYQSPNRHAQLCEHARRALQTPFVIDGVHVVVDDLESHLERAKAAGATILTESEDSPAVGQRRYQASLVCGRGCRRRRSESYAASGCGSILSSRRAARLRRSAVSRRGSTRFG